MLLFPGSARAAWRTALLLACGCTEDGRRAERARADEPSPDTDEPAPYARAEQYATDEDVPLEIAPPGVLGNDDGEGLTARLITVPGAGALTLGPDGSFEYRPDPDSHGNDHFTHAADGETGSATTIVELVVASVNDAPEALADRAQGNEEIHSSIPIEVLCNDTDPDGDELSVRIVVEPAHGTVTVVPLPEGSYCVGTEYVLYVPDVADEGDADDDDFTYEAFDGQSSSAPTTVTIDYSDPS